MNKEIDYVPYSIAIKGKEAVQEWVELGEEIEKQEEKVRFYSSEYYMNLGYINDLTTSQAHRGIPLSLNESTSLESKPVHVRKNGNNVDMTILGHMKEVSSLSDKIEISGEELIKAREQLKKLKTKRDTLQKESGEPKYEWK